MSGATLSDHERVPVGSLGQVRAAGHWPVGRCRHEPSGGQDGRGIHRRRVLDRSRGHRGGYPRREVAHLKPGRPRQSTGVGRIDKEGNICYKKNGMTYLETRPERASGELTIKGTRIRIAQVITMLANGFTIEQLHDEWFPHLSVGTLRGAVEEATEYPSTNAHAETVLQT